MYILPKFIRKFLYPLYCQECGVDGLEKLVKEGQLLTDETPLYRCNSCQIEYVNPAYKPEKYKIE